LSHQYCLEGVATILPGDPVSAYAMVFRTGAVEFVAPLIEPDAAWIEDIIFGAWRQFFDFAKKFNVDGSVAIRRFAFRARLQALDPAFSEIERLHLDLSPLHGVRPRSHFRK
jgi:hypothetical protein